MLIAEIFIVSKSTPRLKLPPHHSTNTASLLGRTAELSVLKASLFSGAVNLHNGSMAEVRDRGYCSQSHSCSMSSLSSHSELRQQLAVFATGLSWNTTKLGDWNLLSLAFHVWGRFLLYMWGLGRGREPHTSQPL